MQAMDRGGDLTFACTEFFHWLLMLENEYMRRFLDPASVDGDCVMQLKHALAWDLRVRELLFEIIMANHAAKLDAYPVELDVVKEIGQAILAEVYTDLVDAYLHLRVREFHRQVMGLLDVVKQEDALRRVLKNAKPAGDAIVRFRMHVDKLEAVGSKGFHDLLVAALTLSSSYVSMLDRSFGKEQVQVLCKVYNVVGTLPKTKEHMVPKLLDRIWACTDAEAVGLPLDGIRTVLGLFK